MGFIVGALAGIAASSAVVAAWGVSAAIIGTITVAQVVGSIVGYAVSGLVTSAFADTPDQQSASARERDRGMLVNSASTVEPIPRVVGFRRVGGAVFLKDLREDDSSKLLIAIAVSDGEIQAFDQVLLDGVPSTDAKFAGLVTTEFHTGTDTQAASTLLLAALPSKWTANHQGKGVAYAVLELKQDSTAFANGLPTVTFDLRGVKMKDPRDGVTRFTPNPAVAIRDYLTNARSGRAIAEAKMDDATFIAEADYFEGREAVPAHSATFTADAGTNELAFAADETWDNGDGVTVASTGALPGGLAAATTYYVIRLSERRFQLATTYVNAIARTAIDLSSAGSGTLTMNHVDQPRYTANGVIDVELEPDQNLLRLRASCRSWVFYSGGKYKLVCDKPVAPSGFVMNEDNIVGNWSIDLGGEEGRYNRVQAKFFNPAKSWAPDFAISDNASERADDGGAVLEAKLALDFTTNLYMAQRIAQIERRKSRLGIRVEHDLTIQGTKVECGDVIAHTHSTPGWAAKLFRVGKMGFKANDEVTVFLMEYADSVWGLDGQSAMTIPVRTNLPDPSIVAPPTNLSFDGQDWELRGEGELTWTAAADPFAQEYHAEYKATADPSWTRLPQVPASSTAKRVTGLTPGDYQFRVRAMNVLGAFSPYTAVLPVTLAAPAIANVTGLALVGGVGATFGARDATFTWDRASADSARYWKDFKVQVCKPDNTVLRTEYVTDHVYTYSWENNAYDNGGAPLRAFKLKVWQRGQQGQVSAAAASLDVSNPQCGQAATLALRAEFNTLFVEWSPPADIDAEGIIVHVSTVNGFTPDGTNRRYKGADRLVVIDNVAPGTVYYAKVACYDAFGEDALSYSAQLSATTAQIQPVDLADLSVTTAKLADLNVTLAKIADLAVSNAKLADDAVTAAKLSVVPSAWALNQDPRTSDASAWATYSGANWEVAAVTDGRVGNNVLRSTGGAGHAWMRAAKRAPIDPNKGYVLHAFVRRKSGNRRVYLGCFMRDGSGNEVQGGTGWLNNTAHYWGLYGADTTTLPADSVWREYTLTIGAGGDASVPSNVKTVELEAILNYTDGGSTTDGVVEVQDFSIVERTGTAHIHDLSVTTSKIADLNVTLAKIADLSVANAKLADDAVNAAKIAADAVGTTELAASAVTTAKIANEAITNALIAAGAVGVTKVADDAISTPKLAAGAVTTPKIAAGAVTANELAANSVVAGKVAAGAITTDKLYVTGRGAELNADPQFADSSAWTIETGTAAWLTGLTDAPSGNAALACAVGSSCWAKAIDYVPVDQGKRYRLEAWAKQLAGAGGSMYLGVAWYGADKGFLESNVAQPTGAGSPSGWSNGGYSYFGMIGGTPPGSWTRYLITCGPGETAAIPSNARYMRVVVGLNNGSTAGVQHAVTGMRVMEKADADLIVDGAIVASKIAAGAVIAGKIAANAVTASEIASGSVVTAKLAAGAVTANELAADSVTAIKILAGAVTVGKIAANAVTASEIASGAVVTAKLAAGAVTANELAADSVTAIKILAGAVTAGKIAADAVTANAIAANAIGTAHLSAGAVTTGKLAAGAVTANEIAADSIISSKLVVVPSAWALNQDPRTSDASAWATYSGANWEVAAVTDGRVGNNVLRSTGGAGHAWMRAAKRAPIDPNKGYVLHAFVRRKSGNRRVYLGCFMRDGSGNEVQGGTGWLNGTTHYWGLNYADTTTLPADSVWREYTLTIGAGGDASVPSNVKTVELEAILNYTDGGSTTDGVVEVQDFSIVERTGTTHIIDGSITASKISVSSLSAIAANMGSITAGNITLDTAGYIKGGQTAYNTGTGFFLGYSGAAYKFSIGNPSGSYMTWDGSALNVNADSLAKQGVQSPLPGVACSAYQTTGTGSAAARCTTDGLLKTQSNGGSLVTKGNWYLPTTTSIGSSYWVSYTQVSSSADLNGGTLTNIDGTFRQLNADVEAKLSRTTTGASYVQVQYTISSSSSGTPILGQGIMWLAVEYNT